MKIHHMEQHSPEWFAIRRGIPTASEAAKILTPTGKLSAQCEGYINQLLAERAGYGDEPMEPTEWMARGTEIEPQARAFFELDTGLTVEQVGFVTNDDSTAGCSPDGLITYQDGSLIGFETKAPKASTHFGYLRSGELPAYYRPQVHMSMAICGVDRWFFQSYFPGLDPLIVLVERDEYTEKVERAMNEFLERFAEVAAEFEEAA